MRAHTPLPWAVTECGGDGFKWWIVDAEGVPLGGTLTRVDADNIVLSCNASSDLYGLVEAVIETYEAHEDRHAQSVLKRLYDKATALRAKARGEA